MQHLQPNTILQGGKNRQLRLSERHRSLFFFARVEAGYAIERALGQGGFGNNKRNKTF